MLPYFRKRQKTIMMGVIVVMIFTFLLSLVPQFMMR